MQAQVGGAYLSTRDLVERSSKGHPLALEESFYEMIYDAVRRHAVTIVDDVHLADLGTHCHFYPRGHYLNAVMMGLCAYTLEAGKKLILGTGGDLPNAASERCYSFSIERFKVDDYAALVRNGLGMAASGLDFQKIFRFAPKLNAHHLQAACRWLSKG
ncbi:MAG TPA: hypothetical protein VNM37_18495, partial [Candidatus Dormibacteraeota bacterium]|nr:hypothetical protein [Candidatus Dormibacteraeota bacterium]